MVNFRPGSRDGGYRGNSGRFGGRDRGGFSRDRDRGRDRRRPEMHEVTCDKCGKQCEVPFKPTSGKPVYCSECFGKEDSGSRNSNNSNPVNSAMSTEQFDKINAKLDRILDFLDKIEFEEVGEEEEEEENTDDN